MKDDIFTGIYYLLYYVSSDDVGIFMTTQKQALEMCKAVFEMFHDVGSGDVSAEDLANSTNKAMELVDEALSQPQIPEGYVLVPVEPTEEMISSWGSASILKRTERIRTYKAMISAAPKDTK